MLIAARGAPLRRHGGPIAFAALGAVAFVVLFYAGRHGTFYNDEWYFVGLTGLGRLDDWMRPWGAHWVMVPMILWRSVFAVVGLGSYLPYLAILLLLHVLAATALYTLVRRASGDLVALCASVVFLFLGSAHQNLFWAFQYGFVISTAAGLWALVAFERGDRRGSAAGAALLLVSLASSGMGVPFTVAAAVELLVDRHRRRAIVWLVPVVLVYALWYLAFGREAASATGASTGRTDLVTILSFIGLGPAASIHALVGLGMLGEVLLYLAGLLTLAILAVRRTIPPRALGAAAGITVMLGMLALGRGVFGVGTVAQPRYLYEGVAFTLLIASALIGHRATPRPTTPFGAVLTAAVVVLTAVALLRNIAIIPGGAGVFADNAGELRGLIALTERYGPERLDHAIEPARRAFMPPPSDLQALMAAHGRLDSDVIRPTVVLPSTAEQRDRALWRVLGQIVEPSPVPERTGIAPPPLLTALGVVVDGACLAVRPGGSVMVELGPSEAVVIQGRGRWSIGLGHEADPQMTSVLSPEIGDGWYRVAVPDLVDGIPYRLALSRANGEARVCSE